MLLAGSHVVVDAPTSAGKTRVIEALLDARMGDGLRLIYTSPVKSLSNDKYREFVQRYGKDKVGINTGDFKENLGAPIILATLETYRNSLLGLEPDMSRSVVVYDEYHYLQDESRGSAWEESIILTPKGAQLILLSASVPNAEEFASWITGVTGRLAEVVRVTKRPVPLVDLVHTTAGWVLASELDLKSAELEMLASAFVAERRRTRRQPRDRNYYAGLLQQVAEALDMDLGPVIVYAARRAEVEALAAAMVRVLGRGIASRWDPEAEAKLKARLNSLSGWEYVPSDLQTMVTRHGVAFHHSGMIPPARVAIESLLKEGLLRVCMGTMGISLGVNFAVRSAFIADESRPGESGEKTYSNSEILQMLGRAGRRGHDLQGFSLWSDLGKFARFRPRERERCVSSLKFDPSTVLGLVDRTENYALLSEFYKKSLFMQGQPPGRVLVFDHNLLSAEVYRVSDGAEQNCNNIPDTFLQSEAGKKRSQVPCSSCPSRAYCHPAARESRSSDLQKIVSHLEEVGALKDQKLTELGRFARHFPQSGGLLIASWLASGAMNGDTFPRYAQALAVFCSAHFKEIPPIYADQAFLGPLRMDTEIEFYYPSDIFPEYYDEVKGHINEYDSPLAFRELNFGAPSIVKAWLDPRMSWERLVEMHSTRFFSAGDCMMVLFRFATYLQSCVRLAETDRKLAAEARRYINIILREPLDARNRMLLEEVEEEERLEPEIAAALSTEIT
jgi:superfamily II RNA helicase